MSYRPLPLLLIGLLHIIEPFNKTLFYMFFYNISFETYCTYLFNALDTRQLLEYIFLFPLAGIMILHVRKWTFYTFMAIQIYVLITKWSFLQDIYVRENYSLLTFFILFGLTNIIIVTYFMFTDIKRPFHNKKLRWWESRPRFLVHIPCTVTQLVQLKKVTYDHKKGYEQKSLEGEIYNLSFSGIALKLPTDQKLKKGDLVNISFSFFNHNLSLNLRVIHHFLPKGRKTPLTGLQFINLGPVTWWKMFRLQWLLQQLNVERIPAKRNIKQELLSYMEKGKELISRRILTK